MTEKEKAEFEHHKRNAERQLSEMYYGKQKNSQVNPSKNSDKTEKSAKGDIKSPSPEKKEENTEQKFQKTKNRLNLLELINFKNITPDNDRITILALCLLLSSEQADELLILALLYIML